MKELRKIMGWVFAISIVPSIWMTYRVIRYIHQTHHSLDQPRSLVIASFFPILTCIYAVAWLTYWRGKPSARGWGIAACMTYVLMAFIEIFTSRRHWETSTGMLTVGIAGLFLFVSHYKAEPDADRSKL